MKLIVGLGNPGQDFEKTVHNVGFTIIDKLQETFKLGKLGKQKEAVAWAGNYLDKEVILLKPQTFVNESGRCLLGFVKRFKLGVEDVLVLQDDITLLPGKVRFRRKSSSGGHNGIKSIINQLGNNYFARIKIGVGNDRTTTLDKWVVRKLNNDKWKEILSVETNVFGMIVKWMKEEI